MDNELTNPETMTNLIRKYKDLIIRYINTPEIIKMKNNDLNEYRKHMYDKFVEFRSSYPAIFDILISGQNIDMLDTMLSSLDHLKTSNDFQNDLNKIRYTLGEKLHNTYVKDKISNVNMRKTKKDSFKFIEEKKKKYKK